MDKNIPSIAEQIISFNSNLSFNGKLPNAYEVLNPFHDNPETMQVMSEFYHRFYHDNRKRKFIIGINPSRNGAGVTGIPFTDTKRLKTSCDIDMKSAKTHEISSIFFYKMIENYGGVEAFYSNFYVNSPFPLAIVKKGKNGGWVNANYYEDKQLFASVKKFMIKTLKKHLSFGLDASEVFILGKKNAAFIQQLNKEAKLFEKLTILEHPRYIQQYKSKELTLYLDKYLLSFHEKI